MIAAWNGPHEPYCDLLTKESEPQVRWQTLFPASRLGSRRPQPAVSIDKPLSKRQQVINTLEITAIFR